MADPWRGLGDAIRNGRWEQSPEDQEAAAEWWSVAQDAKEEETGSHDVDTIYDVVDAMVRMGRK